MKSLSSIFRCVLLASAIANGGLSAEDDSHIVIEGKINGKSARFALDTGSALPLVLVRASAERFGLKEGPAPKDFPLKLEGLTLAWTEPARVELPMGKYDRAELAIIETPPGGSAIDGLVGWPLLKSASINFSSQEGSVPPSLLQPNWITLRILPDFAVLCVELPLAGSGGAQYVQIDTGSDLGVQLPEKSWQEWKSANPKQSVTLNAGYTAYGMLVTEQYWVNEISIGGLRIRNALVSPGIPTIARISREGYAGTLGLQAFANFEVEVDGEKGVVRLRLRSRMPEAFDHNRLGAVFAPADPKSADLVAHVVPGSPAADAGVREGDLLLAIDRRDVTQWQSQPEILPFKQYWEKPAGTKVQLKLKRGTETFDVTAELKNLLGP